MSLCDACCDHIFCGAEAHLTEEQKKQIERCSDFRPAPNHTKIERRDNMTTKAKLEAEIKEKDSEIAYLRVKVDNLEAEISEINKFSLINCKKGDYCEVCQFGKHIQAFKDGYFINRTVCLKMSAECKGFRPIDNKE